MCNHLHTRIHLVVGLGNPGEDYAETKHNAGFLALDKLSTKIRGALRETSTHNSIYKEGMCKGARLILLKPLTFMNASGEAVAQIAKKFKIAPEEVLLVYDDMDIPLGKIRIRRHGGSAGHNGVESIITRLNSNKFARLRIGIGRGPSTNTVDHVLSEFSLNVKEIFNKVIGLSVAAIRLSLHRGIQKAMNEYNSQIIDNIEKTTN